MDFSFLFDPTRKLFSIGFRVRDGTLDPSYYDLLASEARLTSFLAIAKGDVAPDHWFRLGRALTPVGRGSALISWSGSMFEYLMPALVMRAPARSLLDHTYRLVVARQMSYAAERGVPWGISESAFNARDLDADLPVLELRRARPRPQARPERGPRRCAVRDRARGDDPARGRGPELRPVAGRGGRRDATGSGRRSTTRRAGSPKARRSRSCTSYMAHHQGMALVALGNVLNGRAMVERFHADPIVEATELLLQERDAARRARRPATRRRGEERRRRARPRAAGPPPVHLAARRDPADACAVERALRGRWSRPRDPATAAGATSR